MRYLIAALSLTVPTPVLAQSADVDQISYLCDHDNVVELLAATEDPEQITLRAFSRDRILKKVAEDPDFQYEGEGYSIVFRTLEVIKLTSEGVTMTCHADSID